MPNRIEHNADPSLQQGAAVVVPAAATSRREPIAPTSSDEGKPLAHELHVYQVELEMQNEELRRAQSALDAERARYFDLYDLAPVGYCTLSANGLIQQANLTAGTLLGVARSALVSMPITRFIAQVDQDIFYKLQQRLLATNTAQTCELRLRKTSGIHCWVCIAISLAHDDVGTPTVRMTLTDVSANKSAQAALSEDRRLADAERQRLDQIVQHKNTELERAIAIADKANLAKSDFLSSMSHELRTPLGAILGFAQLIESGTPAPTPSQQRSIEQILRSGWYLLDLINEILDLALIESGKMALSLEPIALSDVIAECETMIEPQAQKSAIQLVVHKLDQAWFVVADWTRLKQVLINILSNAIKYNRPGGSVVVDCCERVPGRIRISVTDSGEGLTEAKIAELFQPFNRLGQEAKVAEGTGIGLVVSKRLIELMGGEIGVQSTVGEGSVFWIELTLTALRTAAPIAARTIAQPQHHGAPAMRTLLYVEDNPANLMLVEELIARRQDLHLLSAPDGHSGIAIAISEQPDVILMDINLPGISGVMALERLIADPRTAHIPIVALSANAMPRDIEKGLAAGFFRYLTKPIKVNEFMNTLDLALNFARAHAPGTITKDTP